MVSSVSGSRIRRLLNAAGSDLFALRVFAPLFAVLLAMAGALAVMVYVKAYGSAFAGPAHGRGRGCP